MTMRTVVVGCAVLWFIWDSYFDKQLCQYLGRSPRPYSMRCP